jgi:hypothetical protein
MKNPLPATLLLVICCFASPLAAQTSWKLYEETSIMGTITGTVQTGHVFKTASGNFYEIAEPFIDVVVEVMPNVVVLTNGSMFKLVIKGFKDPVLCRKLDRESAGAETDGAVIESRMDDDFEGYDYENLYKLANGQIWQQLSATYRYRYKFRPRVMIVKRGSTFRMKVEGMDDWVTVERLK